DQGDEYRADGEHDLLLPVRGTADVTALEVLQVVTADAGGATHHGADHDRGHRADLRVLAHQQDQYAGGEQDGGDGDAGDGIVGGAHQSGHVGGDGNEEETGDDHDDGHRHAHAPASDDGLVEGQQGQGEQHQADQDGLHGQVALGMGDAGVAAGPGHGQSGLDARQQRAAQRDQRPHAADQHGADAQVTDLLRPDRPSGTFGVAAADTATL